MNPVSRGSCYNDFRERDAKLQKLHYRLMQAKGQRNKHLQVQLEKEIKRCC